MRSHLSVLILCALWAAGAATSSAADPATAEAVQPQPAAPLITPAELAKRIASKDADLVVLDVRTAREFDAGHVPGALNIPHDQVGVRLEELASMRGKQIVLYCRSGRRSALAGETLRQAGFQNLRQLEGDYPAWESEGRPVEAR